MAVCDCVRSVWRLTVCWLVHCLPPNPPLPLPRCRSACWSVLMSRWPAPCWHWRRSSRWGGRSASCLPSCMHACTSPALHAPVAWYLAGRPMLSFAPTLLAAFPAGGSTDPRQHSGARGDVPSHRGVLPAPAQQGGWVGGRVARGRLRPGCSAADQSGLPALSAFPLQCCCLHFPAPHSSAASCLQQWAK